MRPRRVARRWAPPRGSSPLASLPEPFEGVGLATGSSCVSAMVADDPIRFSKACATMLDEALRRGAGSRLLLGDQVGIRDSHFLQFFDDRVILNNIFYRTDSDTIQRR